LDDISILSKLTSDKNIEEEVNERFVFPDIIIHKRGTNINLCIIEIKKNNCSLKDKDYDLKKLKSYTSSSGILKYDIGIFIKINVTKNSHEMKYYQNGNEIRPFKV